MKQCFKCGETKPLDEFYVHQQMGDGHLNKCKDCTKNDARSHYASNRAAKSAYDQLRNLRPERRQARREGIKRMRAKHPDRFAARTAVGNAVRDGRLAKQPCEMCGCDNVQGHHDDYSKPLDVRWLCFKCHREHAHGQVVTVC